MKSFNLCVTASIYLNLIEIRDIYTPLCLHGQTCYIHCSVMVRVQWKIFFDSHRSRLNSIYKEVVLKGTSRSS